jgi:NADP-dependent 3-hydroxy acid dehydrogenase YdfG
MQTKPKHTEKYTTIRIKTTTREELKKQVSQIDILVNNAGLASGLGTIDTGDIED